MSVFSIDLCHRIVDILRETENLPDLAIQHVVRTPSSRMLLLKDGTVDIDCSANTNTAERRQNAAFSYEFFLVATRFVSLTASNLDKIQDLAGRTVVTTSGSVNVGQLNAENRSRKLNIAVVVAANNDASFQMVGSGHAAAFVTDDILLASLVANTPNPRDYHLSSEAFGPTLPYGLMTRKDDLPFHTAVNAALRKILTSSEIGPAYAKWFTSPIPPHGVNLHLPLSDKLQAMFAHPEEISE